MKTGSIGRATYSNVRGHGKHSVFTLEQRMGDNSVPSTDDMKKHEEHSRSHLVLPSHIYLFISGPIRMPLASVTCKSVGCFGAPPAPRRYLKQNGNEFSADEVLLHVS